MDLMLVADAAKADMVRLPRAVGLSRTVGGVRIFRRRDVHALAARRERERGARRGSQNRPKTRPAGRTSPTSLADASSATEGGAARG